MRKPARPVPAAAAFIVAMTLVSCATGGPASEPGVDAQADAVSAEAPDGIIAARPMPSAQLNLSRAPTRIAFMSCAQQNEEQSLFDRIAAEAPDLSLYIGDNVYGDVRSNDPALPELKTAYMRLAQSAPFARLRAAAPMLTTWDDHDYGLNDAGGEYPYKEQSEALFEYVWAVPEDDPRRARPGVYGAWAFSEAGRTVRVIMLDTRFFRSALKRTDEFGAPGKERYLPDPDPAKTMLGAEQWAWLEAELQKPADLRLLVSSVQVIADGHGWEAWRTLPTERQRLYDLLAETGVDNLVLLSGDRHAGAIYAREIGDGARLLEVTSSSINLPAARWRAESGDTSIEAGPFRLGGMEYEVNYGLIDIDWAGRSAAVSLVGADDEVLQSVSVPF